MKHRNYILKIKNADETLSELLVKLSAQIEGASSCPRSQGRVERLRAAYDRFERARNDIDELLILARCGPELSRQYLDRPNEELQAIYVCLCELGVARVPDWDE